MVFKGNPGTGPSELQALQIVSGIAPLRALAPLGAARVKKMNLKLADECMDKCFRDCDREYSRAYCEYNHDVRLKSPRW